MSRTAISFLCGCLLTWLHLSAQTMLPPDNFRLERMKRSGSLTDYLSEINQPGAPIAFDSARYRNYVTPVNRPASTSCNCWIPRDATWSVVPFNLGSAPDYRNDDGSTGLINLPFNLCFYGQNVNQIYINNNGNISIGASYGAFSSFSFPNSNFVMIAPFWADVDTRGTGSGLVYYQLTATHLIVQWDQVGYFANMFDKVNTFQLIITDGNDPIITPGNNVQFCYKDMQWTTGAASQGVNGFGGTPATVGVNRGNGVDYIQIGRYDRAGIAYDGPYGSNDGVSMLDFQTYLFNVCVSSNNIPPIIESDQVCDTLTLCENDTLFIDANFLSPEAGQTTVPGVNANGMPGVSMVSSTSGNIASAQVQVVGQPGNLGFHTIFLTATDNGVPAQTSQAPIVISVQSAPSITSCAFAPTTPQQFGTSINFTSTAIGGFQYLWNFGDGGPTSSLPNTFHVFTQPGTYQVVLTVTGISGCSSRDTLTVTVLACAVAALTATDVCEGTSSTVTFTGSAVPNAVFNWNFSGGTVISGSGQGPFEVLWNTFGNYPVQLNIDVPGCTTSTAVQNVNILDRPEADILYADSICSNNFASLIFSGNAGASATYQWDFGSGAVQSGSGPGPYIVQWTNPGTAPLSLIVSDNGCSDTATGQVVVKRVPTATFTATPDICLYAQAQLLYTGDGGPSAAFSWYTDSGTVIGSGGALSVQWNTPGVRVIGLAVSEGGCTSDPETGMVNVVAPPVANAGTDVSDCSGQVVAVGDANSGSDSFYWYPATGVTDPTISLTGVLLNNNNPFDISDTLQLVVIDWLGCSDTDEVVVTTYRQAVEAFVPPPPQCISGNNFVFISSGPADSLYEYVWTFGSNASVAGDTGFSVSGISYSTIGSQPVSMQPFFAGCPGAVHTDSVLVTAMPVAAFEALELAGCEPLLVPFNDLSSGNGLSYHWTYSDNADDSTVAPSHLFLQDGIYDVRLQVTTSEGCSDDTLMADLITVYPQPTAGFIPSTYTTDILNPSFRFTNTSSDDSLWFWDFGDGNTSDVFEPGHEYADTGSYPVLLIVTSDRGCIDSVQLLLRVDPWFSFYIPNSFSPNGDGHNDTFGGSGTWIKAYEMEIYDRWGKVIFRTRDMERQWEGKSKEFVQNESYTYRFVITDFFDKDHVYVGRVNVIH